MLISRNWLKTFFDKEIPSSEKLAEIFTFQAFEVEGVNGDILDIKVLPDRAHYALCHKGVALEVSAGTGILLASRKMPAPPVVPAGKIADVKINVISPDFCPRYMARVVENISVNESPEFLSKNLESIGARSINNVVDALNYVMFDMGQPLHAFDADKVKGEISVRKANEKEKITILDGREIELSPEDHVIADEDGPLAIAGVKGGKRAEVTSSTKRIIIESANFSPSAVRRTSFRTGIRNDSSKRFENGISRDMAEEGMLAVSALLFELCPQAIFGEIKDVSTGGGHGAGDSNISNKKIKIASEFVSKKLGIKVSMEEIEVALGKIGIKKVDGENFDIPSNRLDINIPEDLVEEVGRIIGYDKIPSISLPAQDEKTQKVNPEIYWPEKIKNILVESDWDEVMLYSLVAKGEIEVAYPLASDKSFLRKDVVTDLVKSAENNSKNSELLRINSIKIFEMTKVFSKEGEEFKLGLASNDKKAVGEILVELSSVLGIEIKPVSTGNSGKINFAEISLNDLIDLLSKNTPASYKDLGFGPASKNTFSIYSTQPFIVRDIAMFVSSDTKPEDVSSVIAGSISDVDFVIGQPRLLDVFEKDGKKSVAFRLVFQASDRTLTDADANRVMEEKVYPAVAKNGWQVR